MEKVKKMLSLAFASLFRRNKGQNTVKEKRRRSHQINMLENSSFHTSACRMQYSSTAFQLNRCCGGRQIFKQSGTCRSRKQRSAHQYACTVIHGTFGRRKCFDCTIYRSK